MKAKPDARLALYKAAITFAGRAKREQDTWMMTVDVLANDPLFVQIDCVQRLFAAAERYAKEVAGMRDLTEEVTKS